MAPPSTATQSVGRPQPITSRRRRTVEDGTFVAVWAAAGYLLPVNSNDPPPA